MNILFDMFCFSISICSLVVFRVVTLSEIIELPSKIYGKNIYSAVKNKLNIK